MMKSESIEEDIDMILKKITGAVVASILSVALLAGCKIGRAHV